MKMTPAPLKGAFLIDLEKRGDDRGFFARVFCSEEFQKKGLNSTFMQVNDSLSATKGTLRGLHYQMPPFAETKLVRCIKGSLYDVILDLRKGSPTFGTAFGAVLSEKNRTMMYAPEGFAHGFLTLEPNTEVIYLVSSPYAPDHERGVRFDDPLFQIEWPTVPQVISERDRAHPDFNPDCHLEHP